MKKVLFVCSHLNSGSAQLIDMLNQNERIEIRQTNNLYHHPDDLQPLYNLGHKLRNTAAIYGEHLLQNAFLNSPVFYDFCYFVYVIRSVESIEELLEGTNITPVRAINYYYLRIRRLYEMARRTPNAVFLTYDNLFENKGLDLIENYLNLKEPLNTIDLRTNNISARLNPEDRANAKDFYEKYLFHFRKLELSIVE